MLIKKKRVGGTQKLLKQPEAVPQGCNAAATLKRGEIN